MSGPESPEFERWDLAARPPVASADVAESSQPPPDGPAPPGPPRRELPGLPPRFALAALAAGVVAAIALPENRLGLGVLVVALALAGVCRAAAGGSAAGDAAARARRAWGAVALLLASAAVIRDAPWVVLPALLGSLAFGSLAVAGGTTWSGIARGLVAAVRRSPAGPLVVARSAAALVPAGSAPRMRPIARGLGLAVVLVSVFGVLFVTGDAAFAQLAEDALPTTGEADALALRGLAFAVVVALAGGLALARRRGSRDDAGPARRGLGAGEWLAALIALDLLFAAFVGVQLTVLFGDSRHVLETSGLTYSEYAREGFNQLLVAAALTLAVVAAALRYSPPGRRTAIRVALGALCALTVVVLASALHRLDLYQDAYGATRLRFAAHAGILFVGALLVLVFSALAAARFAWLPRATAATAALALIAFVAVDPDLRIAERNVDRARVDERYLQELSADAAPALPPGLADRPPADGLFGWNLARSRARAD